MSGSPPVDQQQLVARRAFALGAGLIVVILLGLAIKGCLSSQHKDALRSYSHNVSSLVTESQSQVSQPFFAALSGAAGKDPLNVEVQITNFRDVALQEAHRAQSFDVPSEMTGAQRDLLLALDLRVEALGKIADQTRTALAAGSTGQQDAGSVIAGEMQEFLASDVLYVSRVKPLIVEALASGGIHDERPADATFLTDLTWLNPSTVNSRLATGSSPSGPASSGTHGHALTGVSFGGQPLNASPSVNRVSGAGTADFTVTITNQGTNDEHNVKVDLSASSGSGQPSSGTKTIDTTKAGATSSVVIPLTPQPQVGVPLKVTAKVEGVPGEKVLSNNSQTFIVVLSK